MSAKKPPVLPDVVTLSRRTGDAVDVPAFTGWTEGDVRQWHDQHRQYLPKDAPAAKAPQEGAKKPGPFVSALQREEASFQRTWTERLDLFDPGPLLSPPTPPNVNDPDVRRAVLAAILAAPTSLDRLQISDHLLALHPNMMTRDLLSVFMGVLLPAPGAATRARMAELFALLPKFPVAPPTYDSSPEKDWRKFADRNVARIPMPTLTLERELVRQMFGAEATDRKQRTEKGMAPPWPQTKIQWLDRVGQAFHIQTRDTSGVFLTGETWQDTSLYQRVHAKCVDKLLHLRELRGRPVSALTAERAIHTFLDRKDLIP